VAWDMRHETWQNYLRDINLVNATKAVWDGMSEIKNLRS